MTRLTVPEKILGFCIFWFVCSLLRFVTAIFLWGSWVVPGKRKHLSGKCQLVIARHRSRWDIPLISLTAITTRTLFIARKGLSALQWIEQNPKLLKILSGKYIVFVDRGKIAPEDAKLVTDAIQDGWHKYVVIFPEGATRAIDKEINPGFIVMAKRYKVPIRPVNIVPWGCYGRDNGESAKKILTFRALFTKIKVGKPFFVSDIVVNNPEKEKPSFQELADRAMEMIDRV